MLYYQHPLRLRKSSLYRSRCTAELTHPCLATHVAVVRIPDAASPAATRQSPLAWASASMAHIHTFRLTFPIKESMPNALQAIATYWCQESKGATLFPCSCTLLRRTNMHAPTPS